MPFWGFQALARCSLTEAVDALPQESAFNHPAVILMWVGRSPESGVRWGLSQGAGHLPGPDTLSKAPGGS
jgi:hypothetical protein